jgi:hypothetical protein
MMMMMDKIIPDVLAIPGEVINPIPIIELTNKKNPLISFSNWLLQKLCIYGYFVQHQEYFLASRADA